MGDVGTVVLGKLHARAHERRVNAETRHVGEVQAAHAALDRDVDALRRMVREELRGQTAALRAEDEHVVGLERDFEERGAAARAEQAHPLGEGSVGTRRERLGRGRPRAVHDEIDERPVVEARALQIAVFEAETKRFDEVETQPEPGREPRSAARVVRDLGVNEDDFQAAKCSVRPRPCCTPQTFVRSRQRSS